MSRGKLVFLRCILALLPALLMGGYVRWPSLAPIPYWALVPWILLYTDDRHPRVCLAYYFVSAYVGWILLYPQAFRFGWFPPFIMGLIALLTLLPFAPLLRRIHHRFHWPRAVIVPVVWVTVEWLRATLTLAHFDLYRLGYSQARFPALVQIADVVGAYGISFLVAAFNGLIADLFFALRDDGWSLARAWRTRSLVLGTVAVALGFGLASLYGVYRLRTAETVEGPKLAVVQPNVLHTEQNAVGVHLSQLVLTDRKVGRSEADLIVWPENAIFDDIRREDAYLEDLAWLAEKKDALMLVGARSRSSEHPGRTTNAAVLVDRQGTILGQYDKQLLFPWSEYVPLDDLLQKISPRVHRLHRVLTRRAWGFLSGGVPGDEMILFSIPWLGEELRFAALICVENMYPPMPAEAGRMGARFLLNITSEGEVGGPVQEQLLRICILRAIESRIPYVRAGNTGISCFIDARGHVQSVLRGEHGDTIGDAGVLIDEVSLSPESTTLYVRSHDAFVKACVLTTLVLLAWSLFRPVRSPTAAAAAIALLCSTGGCYSSPELGDDPARARAALERGRQFYKHEPANFGAAIGEFAAACADPGVCEQAMPYAADCFRSSQQTELAAEFFAKVARRHPELEAMARGYRGLFLERSGYLTEALEEFRRSLDSSPSPRVYGWLGRLQAHLGDRAAAIRSLRAGLALAPHDTHLRFLLGKALRLQGELEEAKTQFETVLASKPDHGAAWVNVGQLRVIAGDEEGALEAFRKAIEVDPENIEARFMIAKRALRESRMDEVEDLLAQIRQIEAAQGRGPREE